MAGITCGKSPTQPSGLAHLARMSRDITARFRQLYDLRRRTFVNADYRPSVGDAPTPCYGCSRIFGTTTDYPMGRGYVTTSAAEPWQSKGGKQIHWVCSSCFEEFQPALHFVVTTELHLDSV